MDKKKNVIEASKAWTIIGIVAVLFVGIGYIFISNVKKDFKEQAELLPSSALTHYLDDLKSENYDEIYNDSLIVEPHYNSKESYVEKIKSIYDGIDLDQLEFVSVDNTDGSVSYKLYNNKHLLSTLTLMQVDGKWIASTIFDRTNTTYYVEAPAGLDLAINAIPLKKDALVGEDVVASNFKSMNDDQHAPLVDRYELLNMLDEPKVTVVGSDGAKYGTLKDVTSNTVYVGEIENDAELANTIVKYAQTCSSFTSHDTGLGSVLAISVGSSDWVKRIRTLPTEWFTPHNVSEFTNQEAFNMIKQSEDSVVAYTTFDFYAANSDVSRTWHSGYQMSLVKVNGQWKIGAMGVCSALNPENDYAFNR